MSKDVDRIRSSLSLSWQRVLFTSVQASFFIKCHLIITVQNSEFKSTAMNIQVQSWFQNLFLKQTRQLHHDKSWNYLFHHTYSNAEDNRLGINPMILPEPEDLPKANPKLE
ncbi:hypothetical protein Tco_1315676 [Tanacetum coccineum]